MQHFADVVDAAANTMAHSRRLRAECRALVEQSRAAREARQRLSVRTTEPHPFAVLSGRRPKRNKLFYKHRWLISRNVVIALRRAGVVCDIIVADHVHEFAASIVCEARKH
jgi:hypothetical protein